jgi:hypothetical protein
VRSVEGCWGNGRIGKSWSVAVKKRRDAADPNYEVEFRGAITCLIPLFINLLEDKDWGVRFESVKVIGKLADHGEHSLKRVAAQLTRSTKSSVAKTWGARFRR